MRFFDEATDEEYELHPVKPTLEAERYDDLLFTVARLSQSIRPQTTPHRILDCLLSGLVAGLSVALALAAAGGWRLPWSL